MRVNAAYPTEVRERRPPRSASQSPSASRVKFADSSRSSSATRYNSGQSHTVYAKEGWRDSEDDVSQSRGHGRPFGNGRSFEDRSRMPGRGHGKERQINYEGENTSFVRNGGLCFVCQRRGHFARECPESNQGYSRGSGGRPGFESALPEAVFGEWKLPWSWRTVIWRAEVWTAVRPGIRATGRSAERSTNPLSTMWR